MNALTALTWEYWRRNRFRIVVALGVLICFLPLVMLGMNAARTQGNVRNDLFPLAMLQSAIVVFFFVDYKPELWGGKSPLRRFLLPLPTWLMVSWQLLCAVVALCTVLVAACAFWAWGGLSIFVRLWPFIVFDVMLLVGAQGIAWCGLMSPLTQIVIVGALGVGLLSVWLSNLAQALLRPSVRPGGSSFLALDQHVCLMILACFMAVCFAIWMVALDRHGVRSPSLSAAWERLLRRVAILSQGLGASSFSSPARAQFWMEWRIRGWVMPTTCALVSLGLIVWMTSTGVTTPQARETAVKVLNMLLLSCVPIAAFIAVSPDYERPAENWRGTYYSTRPFNERWLGTTLLKVNAVSVALGLGIIILPFMLYPGPRAYCQGIAALGASRFGGALAFPLMALGPPVLSFVFSWVILNTLMAAAFVGAKWAVPLASAVFAFIPISLDLTFRETDMRGGGVWLLRFLVAAVFVVLAGSVVLWLKARKLGFVSKRATSLVLGVVSAVAVGAAVLTFTQSAMLARVVAMELLLVLLLALVPFASFPLALYWNRHR